MTDKADRYNATKLDSDSPADMTITDVTAMVEHFQRDRGLDIDGMCGPLTLTELRGEETFVLGVDVSHWQSVIDWTQVAAAGYRFAIIKATQGVSFIDDRLEENATGAKAAGLMIGYYHYADPDNGSAIHQAAHFMAAIEPLPIADLPHVLDVEEESSKLDRDEYSAWCRTFMAAVIGYSGHGGMIYTSNRKVTGSEAIISEDHGLGIYPLWAPRYNGETEEPVVPPGWYEWAMWQYTSKGKVPGISGDCDINKARQAWFEGLA